MFSLLQQSDIISVLSVQFGCDTRHTVIAFTLHLTFFSLDALITSTRLAFHLFLSSSSVHLVACSCLPVSV